MRFKVLDLFCGAGGLSLGFNNAGFDIVGGVDFDKAAMETHKANFKADFEFCGDISEINDELILSNLSNVDVIIGGPPCQGFSAANRYSKIEEDPRNKLFLEYIRFVRLLRPKMFLIENVPGILTRDGGYAKEKILEITSELGYVVDVRVLTASDYGVPQKRKRAFFVGVRSDFNCNFSFDNINPVLGSTTVYDAIYDLEALESSQNFNTLQNIKHTEFQSYVFDSSSDIIFNHEQINHKDIIVERMKHVPQGGNWANIPSELWDTNRSNRHSSAYRRLKYDDVSITIDTGHMNYFHPVFHRVPTVRESARIQSFKDSFIFMGSKTEQYRQVGNAVPPLLAQAIANEFMNVLKGVDEDENN